MKQTECLEMVHMCKAEKKDRNWENSWAKIFFSFREIFAILCKKMHEYREIVAENDPCRILSSTNGSKLIFHMRMFLYETAGIYKSHDLYFTVC